MLKTDRRALVENKPAFIRDLYDKYGSMLLGFILEVVNDRKVAEEYLVKIFCDLSTQFDKLNWDENNAWCELHRFAKSKLSNVIANTDSTFAVRMHIPCFDKLSEEQKKVFTDAYYYGRSVTQISDELNKSQETVRKILKEAFAIIRENSEN